MDNLPKADGENLNNLNSIETSSTTENLEKNSSESTKDETVNDLQQTSAVEVQQPINEDEVAIEQNVNHESDEEVIAHQDEEDQEVSEEFDFQSLNFDQLVSEIEKLVASDEVIQNKEKVEHLKKVFFDKFDDLLQEKKEAWEQDNEDENESFSFDFPLKKSFDSLYRAYKNKLSNLYKERNKNLKDNLQKREAIVEELKNLINPQENIKDTLKHFNELREQWKQIGPIPRDNYNIVWNNYHFHVENFFDFLHLDREARDQEFKNNLELKKNIIQRAKQLVEEVDLVSAFRELQGLHKIWKEDIGPVSKEYREDIWQEFSDVTKQIHERREELNEILRAKEKENLSLKEEVIALITKLTEDNQQSNSHSTWQKSIKTLDILRQEFFKIGRAPSDVNEELWKKFKDAVKEFNVQKNNYYKSLKKEQQQNFLLKTELIAKANEWKDSDDFAQATPIMKAIQEQWRGIGHVPRKYSDKLWDEFKAACNHYFSRIKDQKNADLSEEMQAFENKKAYLDELKSFVLSGDHKTDLAAIKAHIEQWKSFGKVPFAKRFIEGKFNKILDALFGKLTLSKKDSDDLRFTNKLENLNAEDTIRELRKEKQFIFRKIDEAKNSLLQLETNMQFFSSAKKDNPLLKDAHKNIEKHREELAKWEEKLVKIKELERNELNTQAADQQDAE